MSVMSQSSLSGGVARCDRAGAGARTTLHAKAPTRSHCAGPSILWARPRSTKISVKRFRAQAAGGEQTIAAIRNEEDMLALCAATSRGQSAAGAQRSRMASLITSLEKDFTTAVDVDGLLSGTWSLVYSSENPTRSSPFFWAFKGLCDGITQPLPGLPTPLSDALFTITDGIPFAQVGLARHTITEIDEGMLALKSEVEVTLSVMDAFMPPSTGIITSTAELRRLSQSQHEVTVMTTSVKESTWASLPLLSFVDDIQFPSKDVMESMKDGSSAAVLDTTYISDRLRISRVQGMTLVHVRDTSVQ